MKYNINDIRLHYGNKKVTGSILLHFIKLTSKHRSKYYWLETTTKRHKKITITIPTILLIQ